MKTTDSPTLVFELSWLGLAISGVPIAILLCGYLWVYNNSSDSQVLFLIILLLVGIVIYRLAVKNLPGSYLKINQEGIECVERKMTKKNVVHYEWSNLDEVSLCSNRLTLLSRKNRQFEEIKLTDYYVCSMKVDEKSIFDPNYKSIAQLVKQICQENHVVFKYYKPITGEEIKL